MKSAVLFHNNYSLTPSEGETQTKAKQSYWMQKVNNKADRNLGDAGFKKKIQQIQLAIVDIQTSGRKTTES